MNPTDLLVVVAIASGIYAILVTLTRQKQFLVKAVNPHRAAWAIASVSVFWVGVSLMRMEAQNWRAETWMELFQQLVTDAPTPPRVKIAALAFFMSLLLGALVLWCWLAYPRDPTSFRLPKDRAAAFRHFVRNHKGLDYALLGWGDGEISIEQHAAKRIQAWFEHLPKIQSAGQKPRLRTLEDQLKFWRETAANIHKERAILDAVIAPANQGHNKRIVFDCDFGGLFFWYLRPPDPQSKLDQGMFLFGATLNQSEISTGRAELHFSYLFQALMNIEKSVRIS